MSQFELLKERRFRPFFVTQFLGAFNDNAFKNALVILIAFQSEPTLGMSSDVLINLSAGLFILPFFLFSATAGQLADKYEKSSLIRRVKMAEIFIMLAAAGGFLIGVDELLILILFLMGIQSTFFGPVKYAILPQHLREEELVGGNGMVEMGTFVAILLGTIVGGVLVGIKGAGATLVAVVLVAVAVLGWWTSRGIPAAAPVDPGLRIRWNLFAETWRIIQITRSNRTVFLSILGISWFWLYGAIFLAQFPSYTKTVLGGNEQVVTLLLAIFSVGIGAGSLLCERMSGRLVEIGLVPFGAIGMTVFALDLSFAREPTGAVELAGALAFLADTSNWRMLADLTLMAVFGGFFIVPLYALIQHRSEPSYRSRIIAGNNILNALFMVASALLAITILAAGFTIPQLFLIVALLNAAVAFYIFTLVPEFLMRFIVWMLVHTVYSLRTEEIDHIPDEGPAVLVCNHVSYVDLLIITAACRRPIRFVVDRRLFRVPVLRFVLRTTRAIPTAAEGAIEPVYDEIAQGLEAGNLVGIFPEGEITRDGKMDVFGPDIERIVGRTPVQVVPLALRGLYGSFFSRKGGRAMRHPSRLIRRLRSKITLAAGRPTPASQITADALRETVSALRGDCE